MKITVSNEVTLEDTPKDLVNWIDKKLKIDNPDYLKKQRLGKWTGNTSKKLCLYRVDGDKIIVPIGALKNIIAWVRYNNIEVEASEDLADNGTIDYNTKVNLYDYQEDAVKHLLGKGYGILKSKAGSGKTQMGIALACELGKKTLWLTHTQDLLKQSMDRAIACGVPKELIGTITAGKVHIGKGITFATVQTLSKQDIRLYKYCWDVIIVDECHRVAGTPTSMTQFSKVINGLAARHKYGLSATIHRADGLIKSTYMLLGDVAHEVPDSAIADKVMQVRVKRVDTGLDEIPENALDTDGTIKYSTLISELCEIGERNKVIADVIMSDPEHYHLILSDRLSQLDKIVDMLSEDLREQCVLINGKMTSKKAKEEREQAIEDMKAGKKHFLFASYKLAKEGLDVPRLDRLHLATPQKDYAVITQCVGRVARTFEGKAEPICYDYVDNVRMFENMWKKRRTSYRKSDCIVEGE